jgi:hypothetical protein
MRCAPDATRARTGSYSSRGRRWIGAWIGALLGAWIRALLGAWIGALLGAWIGALLGTVTQ